MDVFESKIGNVLVIVYAIASIVLAMYSFFCTWQYCGLLIIVPILPWAIILEGWLGLSIPWAAYPLFLLINVVVVYSIGVFLETLYDSYTSRSV